VGCDVGKVQVLAFANFGTALRSTGAESSKSKGKGGSNAVLDYSKQELSLSSEARDQVCFSLLHGAKGAVFMLGCKLEIQCRGHCRLWDLDPTCSLLQCWICVAVQQRVLQLLCAVDIWAMSCAVQGLDDKGKVAVSKVAVPDTFFEHSRARHTKGCHESFSLA